MKVKVLRNILEFLVGVLLITTYIVLVCVDYLIFPLIIKEFIGSFCVGLCIGKVMWNVMGKKK